MKAILDHNIRTDNSRVMTIQIFMTYRSDVPKLQRICTTNNQLLNIKQFLKMCKTLLKR